MRHDVYVLYGTISCAEGYLILCVDRKCKTDVSAREHLFFCLNARFVIRWSAEHTQVLTCCEESRKGRKVDALAHGGDEGRDKLR